MEITIDEIKKKFSEGGFWVEKEFNIISVKENLDGMSVFFLSNGRYWKYSKQYDGKTSLVETFENGQPKDYTLSTIYEKVGYTEIRDVSQFEDFISLWNNGYLNIKSSRILSVDLDEVEYVKEIIFQIKDRYYLAEILINTFDASLMTIKRVNGYAKITEVIE